MGIDLAFNGKMGYFNNMNDLYSYQSYREYMKDFQKAKKSENPGYSYQVFANDAGYGAKTSLLDVISGKRKLSSKSLHKVAEAMGLSKKEKEFFEIMVSHENAKTSDERDFHYGRMQKHLGTSAASKIDTRQYQYFSEWYHVVVRELVVMEDFTGNFEKLAKRVSPPITKKQAEESVALLLELNLIEKVAGGRYRQTATQVTTGNELQSLMAVKHQKQTLKLAGEALETIPVTKRDISSLTASVPAGAYETIKEEIIRFRKKMMGILNDQSKEDMVYQINFQLFPLTTPPNKE